jgi:predicted AlkP superfamily pyrophosphatase or phosphodiesterase
MESRVRHLGRVVTLAVAACSGAPRPGGGPTSSSPSPSSSPGAGRVVVVSVDGMMPDVYLDPDAHGLAIPTLRSLVARGAAARVRGVMPTVTYPSHTTLVTGVPPRIHGIVSNQPLDPLARDPEGWWWFAEDIAVPTVYQAVEAQHRAAALIFWPVTVGAHASVVVPEYWRTGGPADQKLLRALSTPGLLDEVARFQPALWQALTLPEIQDHAQFAIARYVLSARRPELLLVHVFDVDTAQHEHGPWSPEARAAIEAIDRQLGALLGDLERDPAWGRTTFVVLSDHGFAPYDHEIRLNVLLARHGLIRTDAQGRPVEADVGVIATGGTALVYVLDASRRQAIDDALDDALGELGDHVARRIEHAELVALGGDPRASFALVAAPGHNFSSKRTGDVIVATAPHGTHGWPPSDPAMAASLVAFGPRIPHVALGTVELIDIAPTIARWLGVPLPTATGAPIGPLVPPAAPP